MEQGERPGRTLLDAIKASENEGMQHFDGEIAKLVRSGIVDLETGLCFASNATVLGQELARNFGPSSQLSALSLSRIPSISDTPQSGIGDGVSSPACPRHRRLPES